MPDNTAQRIRYGRIISLAFGLLCVALGLNVVGVALAADSAQVRRWAARLGRDREVAALPAGALGAAGAGFSTAKVAPAGLPLPAGGAGA
jgi:hypothetical protein